MSARDLTHVPLTVFCLPSQPKQGHDIEQGTAILTVLSPSPCRLQLPCHRAAGTAQNPHARASSVPCLHTSSPLQSAAPERARSSAFIRSKKQSYQPGWAGAIADTLLGSFVAEQLCLSYKLLVLPAQLFLLPSPVLSQGPAHQNVLITALVTALWKVLFWEKSLQPPQISWI